MSLRFALLLALLPGATRAPAQDPSLNAGIGGIVYTVPDEPDMLFYIQRSTNENTIVYALKRDAAGKPVEDRPVDVYWKRYQEDGRRAELDFIQRTFAYGIRAKDRGDSFELRCVAYDKVPLFLFVDRDGAKPARVLVVVNDKVMALERIFLQIEGGAFWTPNVRYIEFSGVDAVSGAAMSERIVP